MQVEGWAMEQKQPRALRIVSSDFVVMLSIVGPVVAWALYVAASLGWVFRPRYSHTRLSGGDPLFLGIAVAATVVLVPLALYRMSSIRKVFAQGIRTTGTITSVEFFKDRGRAEYRFKLGSRQIQTGAPLHKTAQTSQLSVGQEVELAVDAQNPKRAFIVDLYC
jgi:hypothetical protein